MRERDSSADPASTARARTKWVSHGLSNAIVYGGLHYGAQWLPMAVLNGINLVGNTLAITFLRETQRGIRENFRLALDVAESEAASLTRRLFFEYGRATIDTWRLRSEAFVPQITTLDEDARALARSRRNGRGFLLVTGHVGNWEMGAVTLRAHDLTAAVVGQPELDPNVQQMRLSLRKRLGVESIDIGSSMATAFRVRAAIDAGRAVALLVDRAYPEDSVMVPFFGRPTPFLRSPALLARFCDCDVLPGFFLRARDGSYFNVWGEPLAADPSRSPEEDARRILTRVASDLEGVIRRFPTQWFNFFRFWNGQEVDSRQSIVDSRGFR
ncbi:MAG TPA: lysophospholipid acyltransferase family protein [Thermoanaerobaculia bacterium]|nr:lysophospholipid acyltransferase family protein [Thermoanaerobaculia bacterium]